MKYSKVFQHILTEIVTQIGRLSNSDFEKINDGTYEISINVKKKLSDTVKKETISQLNDCKSREAGIAILTSAFKNMKELEQFAKSIDVLVLKQDKIDHVREKIIEATVGAVLRSNAIQGKKISKERNDKKFTG